MLASIGMHIGMNFSGSSVYFNKIVAIELRQGIKGIAVLFEASIASINVYVF